MSHSPTLARPNRSSFRGAVALSALSTVLFGRVAVAEPGTHGPSISTWDTRASSVVIGFRPGFLKGGHFDILSYNANFTATNGNLSSQFGVHYLNVRPGTGESVLQGMGATAIALFSIPALPRYDTGQPKLAVGLYLGAAPSVLINGRASYLSIPFPLGIGLPYSPHPAVVITPWFEASPGVNLDTRVRQSTLALDPTEFTTMGTSLNLTDIAVNKILNSAVDFKVSGTVGLRSGLDFGIRLGDSVDFNVNGMIGSLGGGFGGTFVGFVGAGFAFRWDNIVPSVLPAEKRLLHEDCGDIEVRYRACQSVNGPTMTPAQPNANPPPAYPGVPAPTPTYAPAPQYQAPPYRAPAPAPGATEQRPPTPAPSSSSIPTSSFPQ